MLDDYLSPDLNNLGPGVRLPIGALPPKLPLNFAPQLQRMAAPHVVPEGYELMPPYDPYMAAAAAAAAGRATPQFFGNEMFFEMAAPPPHMMGMAGFFPGFKFQRYNQLLGSHNFFL